MIVGIGVDIVKVDRIRRLMGRHGERFLRRIFTEEEIAYCRRCTHPEQRFATRFAAKEAALKARGAEDLDSGEGEKKSAAGSGALGNSKDVLFNFEKMVPQDFMIQNWFKSPCRM